MTKRQNEKKSKRQKDKKREKKKDKEDQRQKTKTKKRVLYCDIRAVSHSCDVFYVLDLFDFVYLIC